MCPVKKQYHQGLVCMLPINPARSELVYILYIVRRRLLYSIILYNHLT